MQNVHVFIMMYTIGSFPISAHHFIQQCISCQVHHVHPGTGDMQLQNLKLDIKQEDNKIVLISTGATRSSGVLGWYTVA